MKILVLAIASLPAIACLAANDQPARFLPGHLAVLRAGDGAIDLKLKQAPVFIDQFDTTTFDSAPSFTVSIPTNGPGTLFFNGHAATEGTLNRSADHKLLSFGGYSGVNLLQSNGTPSLLDIRRAFCTVDAAGKCHTTIYKLHSSVEKMNPRGVVTDGANNFWGCGNANGTVYYNAAGSADPVEFKMIPSSRAVRIINNVLYAAINGADGNASDMPAGIFSFQDEDGHPDPLPRMADVSLKPVVKLQAPYTKNVGFDLNPAGTVAYVADTSAGIQKYVKSGDAWKLAYNIAIPQVIPASENHASGCFGLVADFSGAAPVIFATTTEGYNGCVNSNRVVRIVDTNATAVVTTLAQAGSVNVAFRGIDFTPETLVKP
jgi:hypothetical protein